MCLQRGSTEEVCNTVGNYFQSGVRTEEIFEEFFDIFLNEREVLRSVIDCCAFFDI